MIAVTFRMLLQQPVLARSLEGDPNSAVSHSYIPGSMIRGVIAGRVAGHHADLSTTERELLFDGGVKYLNAYPADSRGNRSVPIPVSWQKDKESRGKVFPVWDEAAMKVGDEIAPTDITLKGFDGFTWPQIEDEVCPCYIPLKEITIHTHRNPKAGRPTGEMGQVYQYDALAAHQRFAGAIVVPDLVIGERVRALLSSASPYIGGAITAGYGRIELSDVKVVADWSEAPGLVKELGSGDLLFVTLLSDAILRGTDGSTHTELVRELNLPVKTLYSTKKAHIIGSFNRQWGLPTQQQLALRAGSVLVVKALEPISKNNLQAILAAGIGEQREVGFGRVAFNWQTEERYKFRCEYGMSESLPTVGIPSLGDAPEVVSLLAQRMISRRYQLMLDNGLVEAVLSTENKVFRAPPSSQLSRLRVIIRDAMRENNLRRVADLFTEETPVKLRPHALKHFHSATIGGKKERLSDWICTIVKDPAHVWTLIPGSNRKVSLGDVEIDQKALASQYAARLLDGVLEQAMRRNDSSKNEDRTGGDDAQTR